MSCLKQNILVIILILLFNVGISQNENSENEIRLMFYNIENFFDIRYDSLSNFNDFTPSGNLHWTLSKYIKKRNCIYKTIIALGEGKLPDIIGLCEIENREVINDLVCNTPLNRLDVGIVHYESNDHRGIDVAMLYAKPKVEVLYSKAINLANERFPDLRTRDILYVKTLIFSDTLHIFINHWTSRYRGLLESESFRMNAAQQLVMVIDSLNLANPKANIVIMGDFNDSPQNNSIKYLINQASLKIVNLIPVNENPYVNGTLKYNGQWVVFDQIIISESILSGKGSITLLGSANIFDASFLLEDDPKYPGLKPYRTNIGYKYNGGVSDHLPVFVDFRIKNQ